MSRLKRTAGAFALMAALGGAGLLTGAALAPAPAAATCEDDECEGGNRCKINTTTGCDVVPGGGCKTVGCQQS